MFDHCRQFISTGNHLHHKCYYDWVLLCLFLELQPSSILANWEPTATALLLIWLPISSTLYIYIEILFIYRCIWWFICIGSLTLSSWRNVVNLLWIIESNLLINLLRLILSLWMIISFWNGRLILRIFYMS